MVLTGDPPDRPFAVLVDKDQVPGPEPVWEVQMERAAVVAFPVDQFVLVRGALVTIRPDPLERFPDRDL